MIKLLRLLKCYSIPMVGILVLVFLKSLSDLYLPTLMSDIVDIGIVRGDTGYIMKVGVFMLITALGGTICAILVSFLSAKVSAGFGRVLRSKLFSHVESFSLYEFDKIGTASLITRTAKDIANIQNVLIMIMCAMISSPMVCIGGIIMTVSKDAKLSLIFVVFIPLLVTVISVFAVKGTPLFKAMQIKLDKLNLVLHEGLTGIKVIRAFNRIDYEKKRFYEANAELTKIAIKISKITAILMPLLTLVMNFASIVIVWFGGLRIHSGNMEVGDVMAFTEYASQIMLSLINLSMVFMMLPHASASVARVIEVLDTVPEIGDPAEVVNNDSRGGCVEFKNVTFHYPGAEQPAVSNISFIASPREVTAIIGGTGSGKSTLISLILHFYDIDSGSILVGGVDIREMSQKSLRRKIGFVPQTPALFTGTVADNIRCGKKDASDDEVRHAAETAQAIEFISCMEKGFSSAISQGGANVSGGQKQRISIARALVRKPEIYIFDDSFSALDFKTDAKLRAALRKETAASTVIMVAQRVSTIMNADRIVVLDDGEIAGIGSHKELLKKCSVYRNIVSSQLSGEEIA